MSRYEELAVTNLTVAGALHAAGGVTFGDLAALHQVTVAELPAAAEENRGSVVYCSNGNGGSPCLAVSTGSAWAVVALGSAVSAT